jgi:predicted kinase
VNTTHELPETPHKQPRIALIVGGIAAGKTTLAQKLQREQFAGSILIDVDQFILAMPEYWKLRAADRTNAYKRIYSEARQVAYKALAKALASRLDIIWELGVCGKKAFGEMIDWLKQLGYHITVSGVDCPVEDALKRDRKRFGDPADPLHFGRDPAWYPPAPKADEFEAIKVLYQGALAGVEQERQKQAEEGREQQAREFLVRESERVQRERETTQKRKPEASGDSHDGLGNLLQPGQWLDTLDPVTFTPEQMQEAREANRQMHERQQQREATPKNSPNEPASSEQKSRCYGLPDRPEGLEEEAEHVGSIYYIPGKGDIVVSWNQKFLRDIRENGFTKALVNWANNLAKAIAKEFRSKAQ